MIAAPAAAGAFYGIQSLLQMLPVYRDPDDSDAPVSLPAVRVGAPPGTLLIYRFPDQLPPRLAQEAASKGANICAMAFLEFLRRCLLPLQLCVCVCTMTCASRRETGSSESIHAGRQRCRQSIPAALQYMFMESWVHLTLSRSMRSASCGNVSIRD